MEQKNLLLSNGNTFPTHFREILPLDAIQARYTGFKQEKIVLKKGTVRREGAMPLVCDILLERDVPIKLRDGIVIYTDIFRPVTEGKYPSIMAWSPYGKEFGAQWLDDIPGRVGVPFNATSQLEKFEGPDPAYWVDKGYAVINPDIRGAYCSEGDIYYWSHQSALDGHDVIEWIAQQPWSNEKVGMTGNSWLTVSQWLIASQRPPHLTAIAPWEGSSDLYREIALRGGIPNTLFIDRITQSFASKNGMAEDMPRMIVDNPLMNEYWEDKAFNLENITIPAYIVASYTNDIHTNGTFEAYRRIASQEKWLRIHNSHEWPDYYVPAYVADLNKFFDYYLKGVENDWKDTPKVRISVYDEEGKDIIDRPESEFPLERTQYETLYLNAADMSLGREQGKELEILLDGSIVPNSLKFRKIFDEDTEVTGYIKLKLWVEAVNCDDLDLAVTMEKVAVGGKVYRTPLGVPIAATGQLRLSLRELDEDRSSAERPIQKFTTPKLLKKGEIVPVEIAIWPMGLLFHKGDELKLTISTYQLTPVHLDFGSAQIDVPTDVYTFTPGEKVKMKTLGGVAEYPYPTVIPQNPRIHNTGTIRIYTGKEYDSYLYVPIIPKTGR